MQATRAKQLLKNGIYRAIGETVAGTGALDGEGGRTLRALMYHKVNDLPGNPVTVPTSLFDEQMAQLRELEAEGVRIECHGISHRPVADLALDEAAREIVVSKLRLEEALGRTVQAFAFVKGSEADYLPVHLSLVRQAGHCRRTRGQSPPVLIAAPQAVPSKSSPLSRSDGAGSSSSCTAWAGRTS